MPEIKTIEIPIAGMDCAECTMHVQKAIVTLPGVEAAEVFLASEKAVIRLNLDQVGLPAIRTAVEGAGYSVPDDSMTAEQANAQDFTRSILGLLGIVFGVVLFVVVVGEWLGLFEAVFERIPWMVGLAVVLLFGYPVFRSVIRAAMHRQIISHTLMTLGVIAALVVGEWATAAVVVFFMRVGDFVEHFTTERARRALRDLTALAPQTARLEIDGQEVEVPVSQVRPGDIVIARPGEKIPVDGEVIAGLAAVDQSSITGEGLPIDAGPGSHVFAATLLLQGRLRIRAEQVGSQTTFGRVIRLVEEAEAHRGKLQRLADRFSAYYLPVVAAIAALTYLIGRDPLATAAVLVVACSCSFALATPIAMLASIGAGARSGLMIKGGIYLERLAQADTLLIDKTGTLTLGKPQIVDFQMLSAEAGLAEAGRLDGPQTLTKGAPLTDALYLAASAERYSEHPLAEALRESALLHELKLAEPDEFESLPGLGVRARVDGQIVLVGSQRLLEQEGKDLTGLESIQQAYAAQGKSLLFFALQDESIGLFSAQDAPRPEIADALREIQRLGIRHIEILTGDSEQAAMALISSLGVGLPVSIRAGLLPEDKIRIVREFQGNGHVVAMVGDGINDAPALAQADVGIAMRSSRTAGSDLAVEAAHIALMRDDWRLVPDAIRIARRTMRVVKMNFGFTAVYNLVGLSLAALGFLPPVLAAAAQSLPDLGILANSSRLLRQKTLVD